MPLVVHGAGAPSRFDHLAVALGRDVRVGDDGGSRDIGRELVFERRPDVGVAVGRIGELGLVGVLHLGAIVREQHVQAGARALAERVVDAAERVAVARFADLGIHEVGDLVEVAATAGREPLALAGAEAVRGEGAQVEQADAEFVVGIGRRAYRRRIDHRAHPVAVVRGETTGVHVEPAHDARVEHARRAQQQGQVERLVQRQAVEHDQCLGGLAAAQVREAREPVARRAGQAVHSLERVVREPRQGVDLLLGEERVGVGRVGRQ